MQYSQQGIASRKWENLLTEAYTGDLFNICPHRAKNIEVFAVLRAYLQSHKVLELRWVEALICIMSVVGAVFSALIVVGAFKVGQRCQSNVRLFQHLHVVSSL